MFEGRQGPSSYKIRVVASPAPLLMSHLFAFTLQTGVFLSSGPLVDSPEQSSPCSPASSTNKKRKEEEGHADIQNKQSAR